MSNLYSTQVKAIGGRSGNIRSEDGILELKLAFQKN
jgi:organic hydroperoxide reductase OsmC/OhrA